uniref:NADH-ubiquinone oxidoreductase chain 2 n=1 Tax=Xya japonica TaxID=1661859 RepID=A0A7L9QCS4_9ORTH|nr:NADH dehydrogenase subunit 2 [Xya japonica]
MTINLKKILFLSSLMMGSFISISSNSWFGVWMGLEMNLLSFIPLMVNDKNMMINESSIKYFIVQALASTMLLFSVLMILMKMPVGMEKKMIPSILISSSLMIKMGAAPFHYWFPEVMKTASWTNCLILMTWQKLAPMTINFLSVMESIVSMITIIVTSIVIGAIGGLNQTYLRQIMAYSSITHVGWMIGAIMINESSWELYFIVYSILSSVMVMMFNKLNLNYLNQLFLSSFPIYNKVSIFLMFFSFLGMPPLLGFIPKWFVIQSALFSFSLPIMIFMLMMSALTLYFYLRLMFSALLLTYPEVKPNLTYYYNPTMNSILNASMMINMIGIFITSILLIFF